MAKKSIARKATDRNYKAAGDKAAKKAVTGKTLAPNKDLALKMHLAGALKRSRKNIQDNVNVTRYGKDAMKSRGFGTYSNTKAKPKKKGKK